MRPKHLSSPGGNLNTELMQGPGYITFMQYVSSAGNEFYIFFFLAEFLDNFPVVGRASSNELKWEEFCELIWVISQCSTLR